MGNKIQLTQNEKNLTKRYLIWCYKTTKEELDKIDRYFTQIKVDNFMLGQLQRTKEYTSSSKNQVYKELVDQFEMYTGKKEANVLKKKFKDVTCKNMNCEYQYLNNRFSTIQQAIKFFLGVGELKKIETLCEQEMTKRILEAREHT